MARKPNQPDAPADPNSLDKQQPPEKKKRSRWRFILGAIAVLFLCGIISSFFTDDAADDAAPTAAVAQSTAIDKGHVSLARSISFPSNLIYNYVPPFWSVSNGRQSIAYTLGVTTTGRAGYIYLRYIFSCIGHLPTNESCNEAASDRAY
jgi:hypothetical protein